LNVKGSNSSELIIWFTVVIAILLLIGWFFTNFSYSRPAAELIENDLSRISFMYNQTCNSYSYSEKYNPLTEKGTLIFDSNQICIYLDQIQQCKKIICGSDYFEINLEKIVDIEIRKNAGDSEVLILEH
jgi:hypothetical protein